MTRLQRLAITLLMVAGSAFFSSACDAGKAPMAAKVPVADVRSEPHTSAQPGIHDPQQETQLLYGERIRMMEINGGWARVEAMEQAEYTHAKRWQGYPGWVPLQALFPAKGLSPATAVITAKWAVIWNDPYRSASRDWQLPFGSAVAAIAIADQFWKIEMVDGSFTWIDFSDAFSLEELAKIPVTEKRKRLLAGASQFIGDPYVWGGRSPHTTDPRIAVSGVDCSGLTSLAYRSVGIAIPRDAHEQYLKARPVESPQPGDLIFLSEKDNPKRIVHVMLYAGQGQILEAPGTGKTVRLISAVERVGQSLENLPPGSGVAGQALYYGSYFIEKPRR